MTPRKILLTPIGSHGDVHPFLALGLELARRGHEVLVITNPHFQQLVERTGLRFASLGTAAEYHQVIGNAGIWDPAEGFRVLAEYALKMGRPLFDRITEHHEPGRTVVVHSPIGFGARIAHEMQGVPLVTVHLAPAGLRSVAHPAVIPGVWMPSWLPSPVKRLMFWYGDRFVVGQTLEKALNTLRADFALPPIRNPLAGWWNSPQRVLGLFPAWFAPSPPDWPSQTRLCDFPLFDERGLAELPTALESFLQAGDPPIVFTPGSAMQHGHRFFEAAVDACARLRRRGLLLTLHADHVPKTLPDTVRHFRYIPLSQVLSRSAALVHHGGIGTTGQGLAGGVPHLVMPMGFDQPDNAARLERLGVGESLHPRRFTGANVAEKLQRLLRPDVGQRCRELAGRLGKQGAVEKACGWIEECGD
jgi:UDP:flavonoid glycosyltransferase YjiC (YdhE family)